MVRAHLEALQSHCYFLRTAKAAVWWESKLPSKVGEALLVAFGVSAALLGFTSSERAAGGLHLRIIVVESQQNVLLRIHVLPQKLLPHHSARQFGEWVGDWRVVA